jgi:mannose-6-phosphate isomerase-like protein (cupin superfamily)
MAPVTTRDAYVISRDQLATAGEFEGHEHGGTGISMIFVDAEPGRGPSLHRHDYDEVFVVEEGQATMTAGDREIVVGAGDIVVVPAGMPHGFVNSGDGPLRQLDIHLSPRYVTEWLT